MHGDRNGKQGPGGTEKETTFAIDADRWKRGPPTPSSNTASEPKLRIPGGKAC